MRGWDQDTYLQAWNYACIVHQGQTVPGGDTPYINHLGLVAMEAMAAIAQTDAIENPNLLVQCALLHDTLEDTATTHEQIARTFGSAVANGVLALTKDARLPTKAAMMQDSLARIQRQPREVWMVKLCDRITNLQPPPRHWSREKAERYRDEAIVILEQLGDANRFLADRLRAKIEAYHRHLDGG